VLNLVSQICFHTDGPYRVVDAAICQSNSDNLHHLKRFIRPEHLPSHLQQLGEKYPSLRQSSGLVDLSKSPGSNTDDSSPVRDGTNHDEIEASRPCLAQSLHFLICSTSAISLRSLRTLLLSIDSQSSEVDPYLRPITVPLLPPSSEDQAKRWSQEYWPTNYKGGNPYGPHPVIVARASQEIQSQVGYFMGLATRAGLATSIERKGEPFGAVVVERSQGEGAIVLAAAGDARWEGIGSSLRHGCGNTLAHAVMRVIGMVAKKRRSLVQDGLQATNLPDSFEEEPLTHIEKDEYSKSTVAPGGYLCLDLELYVTHEPCVMCCMAINHSRFGKVVFGEHMPMTGGLTAEHASNHSHNIKYGVYGLWWRQELNWKFLTWQWVCDNNLHIGSKSQGVQV